MSAYIQDDIYEIMTNANCKGPINPFFIQNLSEREIDAFNSYLDTSAPREELMKYTMVDHDTWLTVVSSSPPQVTIYKNGIEPLE